MSSNPFSAEPNAAKYIPGLQSSSEWLRRQFSKEGTIAPNVPGLLPAAQTVRNAFSQPPNVANYIPGLVPASKALRGVVTGSRNGGDARPKASNTKIKVDGKTYDTGYHSKEIAELRKKYPGGGNAAQSTTTFTPSVTPPSRSIPAPNGGDGRGTQTSPRQMTMDEANSLLSDGYKMVNPFSSTQLPDTSGSPYFGKGDAPQYRSDVPADFYDGELASDLTTGSPFKQGDYTYEIPTNTNIEYLQQEGAPLIQTGGAVKASETTESVRKVSGSSEDPKNSGINWGARTAADNSDANIARKRAFLDADSTMQGMRDMDSLYGHRYAGGQYNMVNPNKTKDTDPDFVKSNKQDYRDFKNGKIKAEELKNRYMERVGKSTDEPADAFTSPPNYTMTPEVDVKTADSQRPSIEVDTSKLSEPVEYEAPSVMFKGGRDKYKK